MNKLNLQLDDRVVIHSTSSLLLDCSTGTNHGIYIDEIRECSVAELLRR